VQNDAAEVRRRGLIAGATILVVHLLYTLFQIASLVLSWHPPFVDVDVLWFSVKVNLVMDALAVAYLGVIGIRGKRPGSGPMIHGASVAFSLIVIGVWGIQLHIGGSQSSHMLAVVLATLLVCAWVLPARSVVWVTIVSTIVLAGIVGLEILGVLSYSPLLPAVQEVRHIFLDWRVLVMNSAIFVCTISVSMGAMLAMRRAVSQGREALRRSNDQLLQEAGEREVARLLEPVWPRDHALVLTGVRRCGKSTLD